MALAAVAGEQLLADSMILAAVAGEMVRADVIARIVRTADTAVHGLFISLPEQGLLGRLQSHMGRYT